MTTLLRRAAALGLLAALVLVGSPAAAHEGDPRIVTTVEDVSPALPAAVVVQAQANLAAQLVVRNPTPTVLEVLGTADRPFLRISAAGVEADVASGDFFTTSNPSGAAPSRPATAAARWVRISAGDSWGWYDHRLHPAEVRAPADERRAARLAQWSVPLRYGGTVSQVRGRVDFRPLLGTFLVSAAPAPTGLVVQALPGRLPGLFVRNPDQQPLTVLGRDGEPFLRFTAGGVEVNERSRTHVEDRQARGMAAGPPGPVPAFRLVAPGATTYTWLDARLRYPQDLPPAEVLASDGPTVVEEWEVPARLAGAPVTLTGDVTWVPEASAAAQARTAAADADGPPYLLLVVGGGALLVLGAAVFAVRRRSR